MHFAHTAKFQHCSQFYNVPYSGTKNFVKCEIMNVLPDPYADVAGVAMMKNREKIRIVLTDVLLCMTVTSDYCA